MRNKSKLEISENFQKRIIRGDKKAMAKFVELNYSGAFQTAFRMTRNTQDAEDACQNAFVHLFRSVKDFKGKSSLKTWFYRIVINCTLDMMRSRKTKTVELDEKLMSIEEHNPLRRVVNKELACKIQNAVEKLGPREKAIFSLKHFDGLKFEQIAVILGISPSTVKTHFYRAITSLQKTLHDYVEE